MQQFLEFLIGSFAALFPVVDPAGGVPIFLVLTAGESQDLRHQLAGKIALYTVVVLLDEAMRNEVNARRFKIATTQVVR